MKSQERLLEMRQETDFHMVMRIADARIYEF